MRGIALVGDDLDAAFDEGVVARLQIVDQDLEPRPLDLGFVDPVHTDVETIGEQ